LFRVLVLESNVLTAKGLKALVSEISGDITVEYHLTAESAFEVAKSYKIDLFVVCINSVQGDVGQRFTQMIKETEKYQMSFFVFLSSAVDDEMRRIANGFYFHRLLPMSLSEDEFIGLLSTLSKYEIIKRGEGLITMIKNSREMDIALDDILWVDVSGKTVSLHMSDSTIEEFSLYDHPFGRLKLMLGLSFIRIYRSIIVNKQYIEDADCEARWLKLKGVERAFKIGTTYLSSVREHFGENKDK